MSESLTCAAVAERALIERYVTGRLGPDEAAGLEEHYLTCARCRQDVRLAAAIRRVLPGVSEKPALPRRRMVRFGIGVGLAAAGVAAVLLVSPPPGRLSGSLASLGAVLEPPVYLGVQVRATPARADSLFESAMAAYAERRYEVAAEGLRAALEAGVDRPPAEFFLGASALMQDQRRDAAAAFRRVIDLGDTPYRLEARFYLAKALLRLGQGDAALEQLRQTGIGPDEIGVQARALAESVEVTLRR